jgi:hypothetical protein
MADPIQIFMELKVDPDRFDLADYTAAAVADGWGDLPENGAWYLAEEIASEWTSAGCTLEVVP